VRAPTNIPPSGPVFGGTAAGPNGHVAMRSDPTGARGPTPTAPQMFDSRPGMRVTSAPPVAGFGGVNRRWWIIVVGAAIIAAISFLITSAVLDSPSESGAVRALDPPDAAPAPDAGDELDAGAEPAPIDAGKKKSR
jgi:hypothetical protein